MRRKGGAVATPAGSVGGVDTRGNGRDVVNRKRSICDHIARELAIFVSSGV
jgi:hypothetical protein